LRSKKQPLVLEYYRTRDNALKDPIVREYKPLINYIARKLAFNKEDTQDLMQVGTIALLKALDRFRPEKETDFATFATPNIIGEIKHYFRDKSRLVKVPRKLQELYSKVKNEIRTAQKNRINLTIAELAERLDVPQEKVLECMEAGQSSRVLSLDAPSYKHDFFKRSDSEPSILDNLGTEGNENVLLNKETVKQAILKLNSRERRIVYLRFYGGLSQVEIAKRMKLSQMHISRLLMTAVKKLRKLLVQP